MIGVKAQDRLLTLFLLPCRLSPVALRSLCPPRVSSDGRSDHCITARARLFAILFPHLPCFCAFTCCQRLCWCCAGLLVPILGTGLAKSFRGKLNNTHGAALAGHTIQVGSSAFRQTYPFRATQIHVASCRGGVMCIFIISGADTGDVKSISKLAVL